MAITTEELTTWSRYIQEICGISLDNTKGYLLETRLSQLLRETSSTSLAQLYLKVRADSTRHLQRKVIDAVTTSETSFFRDGGPFELLREVLIPELISRRSSNGVKPVPLRIWSAACSTGQEVYSTAIIIKDLLRDLNNYDVQILGTDISDQAVAKASYGLYSRLEIERGLPPDKRSKYFSQQGNQYRIRDDIRSMALFKTMNLLSSFSFPRQFDIILCRNVAIYFTEKDRLRLFKNIERYLAKDGSLIIGSTESIVGLCPEFTPQRFRRSVYYRFK